MNYALFFFYVESTPVEQMVPRAHSTPKEPEVIVLSGSESDSESDGDDEYDFCCTQDTLQVQWDYSNTPKGKDRSRCKYGFHVLTFSI